MFIQNLNDEQKAVFLHLAERLISIDGKITEEETSRMKVMRSNIGTSVVSQACSVNDLAKIFNSKRSQGSTLLELIGLAYADLDFDPAEKSLLEEIAHAIKISHDELEDMISLVVRQLHLAKEATSFLEE